MSDTPKTLLEVGDKIAKMSGDTTNHIYTIDRVTKTMAFVGQSVKFQRRVSSHGSVMRLETHKWTTTFYVLASDEQVKAFESKT